jgi:dTDP-4-amino-4,6-dideoxygalactose transaminase
MIQIPVAKPVLDEQEVEAVRRVILSGWVTQGPEVAAFEQEFAEFVGAAHACAVSNCTTALHLALLAVGVTAGDEVITVSHSFIATANAIRYCGATPVFVDVEADGFNIDPDEIEAAITPRTKAIICVHQLGMPCDLHRIVEIATRHSIPVIEDAACATGSEIFWKGRWEKIGKPHGDIACFSFHPRKVVTTGTAGC